MGCGSSKVGVLDPERMGKGHNSVFRVLNLGDFTEDGFRTSASLRQGAFRNGGGGAAGELSTEIKESDSAVKVMVAVRPLMSHEDGCQDIVATAGYSKITVPKRARGPMPTTPPKGEVRDESFDFDRVVRVDNEMSSKQVFGMVVPVVQKFSQGFNGTVLAYGQTGSGKTYTMGTSCSASEYVAEEPRAVVPRVLKLLYHYIAEAAQAYDVILKVQYVELYNNEVVDLLATSSSDGKASKSLDIRERTKGEVYVEGAVERVVGSRAEVAKLIQAGNQNRTVAAHKMNSESSRSHAVITLSLEQRVKRTAAAHVPKELHFLRSKLHLVDLAGSERVRDTGATGNRFSEGVNINKGLLALGNVINALSEGKKRTHVPYRDSKLTRLLADSLGGSSETLFIACVSPADKNHEQTLNTLRYASRARAIRNHLRQNNKMTAEEEIEYLKSLVSTLQEEVHASKSEADALRQGMVKCTCGAATAAAQTMAAQRPSPYNSGAKPSPGVRTSPPGSGWVAHAV